MTSWNVSEKDKLLGEGMMARRCRRTKKAFLGLAFFVLTLFMIGTAPGGERSRSMVTASAGMALVPFGKVDSRLLQKMKSDLGRVVERPVVTVRGMPEPRYAFHPKPNQYLSTAILNTLLKEKEYEPYEKLLGIVDVDLYVPDLHFVFGQASPKAAVISLVRLRQEYYGLSSDEELFYRRIITEGVQELGHGFGLRHCPNPRCVMFFSNSLVDTDRKGPDFCKACTRGLKNLMGGKPQP